MSRPYPPPANRRRALRMRGLSSLAMSLLVVVGMFRFWPTPSSGADNSDLFAAVRPQEIIELELIEQTVQDHAVPPAPPPPPPPDVLLPPVEVPDTRIIEERVLDLEASLPGLNSVPNAPPSPPPGPAGPPQPAPPPPEPTYVRSPDRFAQAVRIVVPVYPPEARRNGIRARVRIQVLVDERGRGSEEQIVERILLDRGDNEERVSSLPHGIDQSALAAARRYQFRPARHDGRAVRSHTTITISVGL